MESLENHALLTVTTLTVNSISDGSLARPGHLLAKAYQVLSRPADRPHPPSVRLGSFSQGSDGGGTAGVSSNGSAFTSGDPPAPSGNQVAFIQNDASISQTVNLDAGVYNLSMLAARRLNYQSQPQAIQVWIDYGTPQRRGTVPIVPAPSPPIAIVPAVPG